MEYNEPLNLSIKKRPIAVVTPSSSNNKVGTNASAVTASGPAINSDAIYADENDDTLTIVDSDVQRQQPSPLLNKEPTVRELSESNDTVEGSARDTSSPATPNTLHVSGTDTGAAMTLPVNLSSPSSMTISTSSMRTSTESVTTAFSSLLNNVSTNAPPVNQSPTHNLSLVDLLYGSSSALASTNHSEINESSARITGGTDPSIAALASSRLAAIASTAAATASATTTQQTKLTTSIADATNTLTAYLNQQQSLDIAKMHLEQYLKITNQYLHSTLDGANMTSNEQINHLIRTNILTNKIAANNLISIINKLLEQNIISEYYFKHASRLMMQSYDGMTIGDNNGVVDVNKDVLSVSFAKRKTLSSPPPTTPSPQPLVQSELLKQLAKRQFNDTQDYDGEGSDGDASGDNSIATKNELPDYDDTIKKETIPIASNASPFISYLHLHFNRDLAAKHKASTPPKYFNGSNMSTALSPPSDSTSPISPLLAPAKAKHKSHKAHSDSSNSNSSSNNNNYSKSTKHHIPYDLSLSLNQRLTQQIVIQVRYLQLIIRLLIRFTS